MGTRELPGRGGGGGGGEDEEERESSGQMAWRNAGMEGSGVRARRTQMRERRDATRGVKEEEEEDAREGKYPRKRCERQTRGRRRSPSGLSTREQCDLGPNTESH